MSLGNDLVERCPLLFTTPEQQLLLHSPGYSSCLPTTAAPNPGYGPTPTFQVSIILSAATEGPMELDDCVRILGKEDLLDGDLTEYIASLVTTEVRSREGPLKRKFNCCRIIVFIGFSLEDRFAST